jgi:hypothetical protein
MALFKTLFRYLFGGTEETHEKPHDNQSPGRDLNLGPPEYEAGVLTTWPRRLVNTVTLGNNVIVVKVRFA